MAFIPAVQARETFDPSQPCTEFLQPGEPGDATLVVFWASGYLGRTQTPAPIITPEYFKRLSSELSSICAKAPQFSLVDVVSLYGMRPQTPAAPKTAATPANTASPAPTAQISPAVQPPSPRALLLKFFEPGADRAALTAALKPTEADIRAVYAEPLATALVKTYNGMFKPGVSIGPKPEHKELFSVVTSTGKLKSRNSALESFPGGYKKVLPYFRGDYPIVRFKFVKPGETSGFAFDGLLFVNGRWVLMPKPWRALEN